MTKTFCAVAVVLCLSLVASCGITPATTRALSADVDGLPQPAPGLFTDAPERSAEFLAMIANARATSAAFFGSQAPDPRHVICTTQTCADRFDLGSRRGLALGTSAIVIGPKGVQQYILTHERVHTDLAHRLTVRDVLGRRYPAWFNEGLATLVSDDPRLVPNPRSDTEWVTGLHNWADWGRAVSERGWNPVYTTALSRVTAIDGQLGRAGLRALIDAVAAGAAFDAELQARLERSLAVPGQPNRF